MILFLASYFNDNLSALASFSIRDTSNSYVDDCNLRVMNPFVL